MFKKNKIIYLVSNGHYGGAQKYNLDLARFFGNEDFLTEIAFSSEGNTKIFEKKLKENSIKYTKLRQLQRSINPIKEWLAFWEIYSYLKKEKPDILHISSSKVGVLGRCAGWLNGVGKIYYTAHGWVFNENIWWGKKYFYLAWERFFALFCDKIFCVSQYDIDTAIRYGFDEKKLKLIYNGISKLKTQNSAPKAHPPWAEKLQQTNLKTLSNNKNLHTLSSSNRKELSDASILCHPEPESAYSGIRAIQDLEGTTKTIGTVANFFPPKNLGLFVEIADELIKEKKNNYRFVIVGGGPEREKIEKIIEQKNLKKYFVLPGLVEDYEKIAKDFDVFLMTSSKEGFPYILLEIGLMKIPIIASNVGGIGELIIDGETGCLVTNLNKGDFVDKIGDIVDKKNTQEMSDNLYKKIEREFNINKMMREYEKMYFDEGK